MANAKILVIDDEQSILDLVSAYLQAEEYEVQTAADGITGLAIAKRFQPDLIVLDVMLPGMDGIELLTRLRRESDVYVIMLTAKTEETDKVIGLTVGADDYLTKPFSPRELVARIKAALRRLRAGTKSPADKTLVAGQLRIDPNRYQAWVNDKLLDFTTTEFELLKTLVENQGRVLSREQLLEKVWGQSYFGEIRVVDVHIGHIRQKLGNDTYITTVRGIGYRFEDEVE